MGAAPPEGEEASGAAAVEDGPEDLPPHCMGWKSPQMGRPTSWTRPAVLAGLLSSLLALAALGASVGLYCGLTFKCTNRYKDSLEERAHRLPPVTRVIVTLKDGSALSSLNVGDNNVTVTQNGHIAIVETSGSDEALRALQLLQLDDAVEFAEEDQWLWLEQGPDGDDPEQVLTMEGFELRSEKADNAEDAPVDSGYSYQWNLHGLGLDAKIQDQGLPGAWAYSTGSKKIKVCLIDSGIDYTHPDLAGNIWTNPGEIPGDGIDNDGNGFVDDVHGYNFAEKNGNPMDLPQNGHGTHVAGIIGAVGGNGLGISGVVQQVSIIACKFLRDDGRGLISDAILCMDYCQSVGAQVITSSAGDPSQSSIFKGAVQSATKNTLFVCSAGNDATDADVVGHYPSGFSMDNILAVAATGRDGRLSSYSNWGLSTIDIAAPGDDVWSTFPGHPGGYKKMKGSSMAVPHVSGAAALLLSMEPSLSIQDIKEILLESVDSAPYLEGRTSSGGRLHIGRAAAALTPMAQFFGSGDAFNLAFSAIRFDPAAGKLGLRSCGVKGITGFPVSPQGGHKLSLSNANPVVSYQLAAPFLLKGWLAKTVRVHINGALTFGALAGDMNSPNLAAVGFGRQILPLWTQLSMDEQSEVTVVEADSVAAFTFSKMLLNTGRATFQAVLHPGGSVSLAWLWVHPAKLRDIVVGFNPVLRDSPTTASASFSDIRTCRPDHFALGSALPPPPVQQLAPGQTFNVVQQTVCYRTEPSADGRHHLVHGCNMPDPAPVVPVDPAGGLGGSRLWLATTTDSVAIQLLKGRVVPFAGGEHSAVYVTGQGLLAFSPDVSTQPVDGADFEPSSLFSGPQVAVLASSTWADRGGLLVDHKQLADKLVVTLYAGGPKQPFVPVIAQVSVSWDGSICVTYPQSLLGGLSPDGHSLDFSTVIGASATSFIPASGSFWLSDLSRQPSCLKPPVASMPAEIFQPGVPFDLDHRLLRFSPLGSSSMGVCLEPAPLKEFPVDPSGGDLVPMRSSKAAELWLSEDSTAEAKYPLLGRTYDSVMVGAAGYLSFDSSVAETVATQEALHRTRRIAAMLSSLQLADFGTNGRVTTQRLADRWAVTYQNAAIQGAGSGSSNNFQIALYSDGRVDLSFLGMDGTASVPRAVGISGGATPPGWAPSDLSAAAGCRPALVESFDADHPFDLENKSVRLRPLLPDPQGAAVLAADWAVCLETIPPGSSFPVSPADGTLVPLSMAGDSAVVGFEDGMIFPFLGTDYRHVHVSSSGHLTFDQTDGSPVDSLAAHYSLKRISVFTAEMAPRGIDQVSGGVFVSHLPGRVVITWKNAESPVVPGARANFQAELHGDGAVVLSYLTCHPAFTSPTVGISGGTARSPTWQPTDLSDERCPAS